MKHCFTHAPRLLFLAAVCCSICSSGCDSGTESQLRKEVTALRQELRDLQLLRYDMRSLEQEVAQMRGRLAPADGDITESNEPITRADFEPDGSHLDDPFLGPKNAQTIVMAFGDFQCKPCRTFFRETFGKLKEEFTDTDKLRFIYRDFPLRSHPFAAKAATLSHCAGEQGEYWQMFELLFRNPEQVDAGELLGLAKKLPGVDTDRLVSCFESTRYDRELQKDIAEAVRLGAKGAPGFFVGRKSSDEKRYQGVFIRGAQPYEVLAEQIQRFL